MKIESLLINLNPTNTLVNEIIDRLNYMKHDLPKGEVNIQVFSDGETCVDFKTTMRGKRVYLLTSPDTPLKREQLVLAIDAARRASAMEIIPIMPYFPYARQDKRDQKRGPIGARVLADNLQEVGATSIITLDLHSDQIEGFFKIPVIHLRGKYIFSETVAKMSDKNTILCSPDAGGLKRVKKYRDRIQTLFNLKIPFISLDKTRIEANKTESIEVLGDVKGKNIVILDDMADTCGTLIKGVDALLEAGATEVSALVTHPLLSGDAIDKLYNSNMKTFVCSNSLEPTGLKDILAESVKIISLANEITDTIIGINADASIDR